MPLKGAPRSSISRTELGIVDRSVWRRRTTLEAKNLDQQKKGEIKSRIYRLKKVFCGEISTSILAWDGNID
jgi:hypothetical protein